MIEPLAEYQCPVDDPGGGQSMVRHVEATSSPPDPEARSRLLDYNMGDIEATRAIRDWLQTVGASLPVIGTG